MSGARISDSPTRTAFAPADAEPDQVRMRGDSTLADDETVRWDAWEEFDRVLDARRKGAKIAIVDPDDRPAGIHMRGN